MLAQQKKKKTNRLRFIGTVQTEKDISNINLGPALQTHNHASD